MGIFESIVVLTVVNLIIFTVWYFWFTETKRALHRIPSLSKIPLIGNMHHFDSDPSGFYEQQLQLASKFSEGFCAIWFGEIPTVLIYKAEHVEVILKSSKHITKAYIYFLLKPWLGTGLLTSDGDKWFSRRKMLTPTFHFKILNDFVSVFNTQTQVMTRKLESCVGGEKFDVLQYIASCTLDIICETAMGRSINAQDDTESDYVKAIHTIGDQMQKRLRSPWLHSDFIYKLSTAGKKHVATLRTLHSFSRKIIEERSEEFKEQYPNFTLDQLIDETGRKRRLAFLDMLLCSTEDGRPLSVAGIQEEVDTFMFEGHDTTAAAASWATYLLGRHPEIQDKLQAELDRVLGRSEDQITVDDLKDLQYLECVIKESLRLYPSVPFFGRTTTEGVDLGDYTVPKGTDVFIFASALHRDQTYFPNPEKFDPDRFSHDNSVGRHPFAYVPFSAGPRNCIGQRFAMFEEKILLASIFRKFNVTSLQKPSELRPHGQLITRPAGGIFVQITSRT